ncbi:MAG: tRNA-guanine transglycosylase, partial [Synergistaceae bacterium]|nr:tRNA-guanine transglycosylase [Synergistaceae bacterium]
MKRALDLAILGRGKTSPNPLVGCVIVKDNKIIGEGWHKEYGKNHAEIEAINDAKFHNEDIKDSTVYVTLEPCSHFGKTPPCANRLISEGVKEVVTARRGELTTPHGVVQTPAFMNVATCGAIKGAVSAYDLKELKCQVQLCNTYHLHVRPGDELVYRHGGLHR